MDDIIDDFKNELLNDINKLDDFYWYAYENGILLPEEMHEIQSLMKSHKEVIEFLGGADDKVSKDI